MMKALIQVRLLVDDVTLEEVSPSSLVSLWLRTHISLPHDACTNPLQAAHYHTFSVKIGVLYLICHSTGLE
jgi:hypothetical protein